MKSKIKCIRLAILLFKLAAQWKENKYKKEKHIRELKGKDAGKYSGIDLRGHKGKFVFIGGILSDLYIL